MKNSILKDALKIEQLEDRFEMTVGALDGNRCCICDNDVEVSVTPGGGAEQ